MFDNVERTMYILNKIIFFVLIILFYLLGLKIADRTFRRKEKNMKEYYSIALASPIGFLIGFFIIDSIYHMVINANKFMASHSLIVYWSVVVVVGLVIGFSISFFMIKRSKKGE